MALAPCALLSCNGATKVCDTDSIRIRYVKREIANFVEEVTRLSLRCIKLRNLTLCGVASCRELGNTLLLFAIYCTATRLHLTWANDDLMTSNYTHLKKSCKHTWYALTSYDGFGTSRTLIQALILDEGKHRFVFSKSCVLIGRLCNMLSLHWCLSAVDEPALPHTDSKVAIPHNTCP